MLAVSLKPDAEDEKPWSLSDRVGALFDGTRTAPMFTALRVVEAPQSYLKALDSLVMARGAYKIAFEVPKEPLRLFPSLH